MPIKLSVDEAQLIHYVQYVGYDRCDDDVKDLFDHITKRIVADALPSLVELRRRRRTKQ